MRVWRCIGCGMERRATPIGWPRYEPGLATGRALEGICPACRDLRPRLVRDWDEEAGLSLRVTAARCAGAGD